VTVTDPSGTTSELDRFTLPEEGSAEPYTREPEYEVPSESGVHEIEVTANGQLVAKTPIDTGCVVVPQAPPEDDGSVVVDDEAVLPATGMGAGLSALLALGLGMLAAGGTVLVRNRIRVRHGTTLQPS
jgi:LPXTG-motif cell wall-anchored protein